jgi:hypothetical protein
MRADFSDLRCYFSCQHSPKLLLLLLDASSSNLIVNLDN